MHVKRHISDMECTVFKPSPLTTYSFLAGTLNALIVEDDDLVLDMLSSSLEERVIYRPLRAHTAHEALGILGNEGRIHVAILDFGIRDLDQDELSLVRRFGVRIPFVVLTGRKEIGSLACAAGRSGVKAVFHKGGTMKWGIFWRVVDAYALIGMLDPNHDSRLDDDPTRRALQVLLYDRPETVALWAAHMDVTERTLRRICADRLGLSARDALLLYRVYSNALVQTGHAYQKDCDRLPEDGLLQWCPAPISDRNVETFLLQRSHLLRHVLRRTIRDIDCKPDQRVQNVSSKRFGQSSKPDSCCPVL